VCRANGGNGRSGHAGFPLAVYWSNIRRDWRVRRRLPDFRGSRDRAATHTAVLLVPWTAMPEMHP
jgi:hypothetical protein